MGKKEERQFYTVRGYALMQQENESLTPSMEDYLEMVARLSQERGFTRIGDLAKALNVQPPSTSKMVQKLAEASFLEYEKYGLIELTKKGQELGQYLLERHESIEQFLKMIGVTKEILQETEKIEHNISEETMLRIRLLVDFMKEHEGYLEAFANYQNERMTGGD